jgi:hypothetical protein
MRILSASREARLLAPRGAAPIGAKVDAPALLDERRDLGCEKLGTLGVREPWIHVNVADDDRLAAPARVGDVLSEACHGTATG